MKGFVLKKLVLHKAVIFTLIAIFLAVPALFLSGCSAGQVVAPFNPKEVKPQPYTPEPEWTDKTDTMLTSISSMKKQAGQSVAPGATSPGTTNPGTTTTPGTTNPGTPTPGPEPGPAPSPGRVPLSTDPIYGVVRDRIEGGVIPNATVTLTERRGATVASFVTNSAGEYSFVNLAVGYYKVTVAATGYVSCPLSTVDLNYFGVPVIANLELVYGAPWQIIEGGNFNQILGLGNIVIRTTDGTITDPPPANESLPSVISPQVSGADELIGMASGGQTDGMQTPFYSAATQQTYNAFYVDNTHGNWTSLPGNIYTDTALDAFGFPLLRYQTAGNIGLINSDMFNLGNYATGTKTKDPYFPGYLSTRKTTPWAQYDFFVPAPASNSYSYDGLWVTYSQNFKVNSQGVWSTGGNARTWYYDWYFGGWRYIGDTLADPLGQFPFTAVNPSDGRVSLRISPFDENPFVVTGVKLTYDYRKDTAAPTYYEQYLNKSWDAVAGSGSVWWVIKLQEEGFVTVNVTGPSNFSRSAVYYAATIGDFPVDIFGNLVPVNGLPAGSYQYTITASDLPGNTKLYGPFAFSLP
jgi:hypothetical protein